MHFTTQNIRPSFLDWFVPWLSGVTNQSKYQAY